MNIRSEQGASAVEFALVLPLLALLTFGIIEFGILLYDKAVITNASREGARAGIVYRVDSDGTYAPVTVADIRGVVKDYANDRLINLGSAKKTLADADITVSWNPSATSGSDLTVNVQFSYDFLIVPDLSALVGGTFDGSISLPGVTRMRME